MFQTLEQPGEVQTSPPVPQGVTVRFRNRGGFEFAYRSATADPSSLVIEHRWRHRSANLGPTAVWAGSLWVIVLVAVFQLSGADQSMFWMTVGALGCGLVLALAVLLTYWVSTMFLNTTTITIDSEKIVIRSGPIPTFEAAREIPRRELSGLYTKKIATPSDNRIPHTFALVARLRGGEDVDILAGVRVPEPCLFIQTQISAVLEELDLRQIHQASNIP